MLLSLEEGRIQAVESDINPAGKVPVGKVVADASVDDYDALSSRAAASIRTTRAKTPTRWPSPTPAS